MYPDPNQPSPVLPGALRIRLGWVRLVFVVVALSLLGLYWFSLARDWQQSEERVRTELKAEALANAVATAEYVQSTLDRLDLALQVARDAVADGTGALERHGRFITGVLNDPMVFQLFHIGADGYLAYSSLGSAPRNYLADRDYFKALKAADDDRLMISNPVLGRLTNKWSLQVARAVRGADGSFGGVMSLAVSPDVWSEHLRRLGVRYGGVVAVLGADGSFLLRSLDNSAFYGRKVPGDRPFLQPGAAASGVYEQRSFVDGILRQFAWQRLESGLTVVAGIPVDEALAPVREARYQTIVRGGWSSLLYLFIVFMLVLLLRYFANESALASEREARIQTLFSAMAEGVAIVTPDGNVQYYNDTLATMLRVEPWQLQNRAGFQGSFGSVDAEGRPLTLDELPSVRTARTGEAFDNVVLGMVHADQAPCWHSVTTRPLYRPGMERPYAAVLTVRDITGERAAQDRARISQRVFDAANQGIIVTDAASSIIAVNPAFTRLTGYGAEEVIGRNPSLLSAGQQAREFFEGFYAALDRDGSWDGEFINRHRNGEIFISHSRISCLKDDGGRIRHYVCLFSDITERKRKDSEIWHQANFDSLTGLPNRTLLEDRIHQLIRMARRRDSQVAVLFIDLDRFKPVNDQYGHAAGDDLLRQVAHRLQNVLREEDTVARLGGDEFVVVLPNVVSLSDAERTAARVVDSVSQPYRLGQAFVEISCSIGIATFPEHGDLPDVLMEAADQAMYRAKQAGRSTWHL